MTKAVLAAMPRSGKQFLAACLSNHPDIHCQRDEPLARLLALGLSPATALEYALTADWYRAAVVPLTYDQLHHPEIAAYLLQTRPKIINLTRRPLERITSVLLAKLEKRAGVSRHLLYDAQFADDERIAIEPQALIRGLNVSRQALSRFEKAFAAFDVLTVDYSQLTAASAPQALRAATGRALCKFLGVDYAAMSAPNRKMHRRELPDYYHNWDSLQQTLEEAGEWPI